MARGGPLPSRRRWRKYTVLPGDELVFSAVVTRKHEQAPRTRARFLRGALLAVALVVAAVAAGYGALRLSAASVIGADAAGTRLERMRASPRFRDGRFTNVLPRVDGPPSTMLRRWVFGGDAVTVPEVPVPTVPRSRRDYDSPPASGLRATWLGHSTVLLEIEGRRVLIDPVWGDRASPFGWAGPARWYAPPLPLAELPPVDAVILSHDHYDHLDAPTVRALSGRVPRWVVPLGIGADLESWGVTAASITELDWWESTRVAELTLTATPARHFSGRWPGDGDRTLWAGWAVVGERRRVFYSGDTALHGEFDAIGERLGPFDLALIEVGAYDALWADVHLGPEQAVEAHRRVRGAVLLPVHWGLFDLALHGWTEPVERLLVASERAGVRVVTPRPGELVEPDADAAPSRWWPSVPWRRAEDAPVVSSGLAAGAR